MKTSSVLEIGQTALANNIAFIRSYLADGVGISIVVKGNAYGHGIPYIVPMAEKEGINHFSVFSADEARVVKESATSDITIMIMGFIYPEDFAWVLENEVEFFVYQKEQIDEILKQTLNTDRKAYIHLEVETGMNRTGFDRKQLREVIPVIKMHSDKIHIKGVCTHYAGAESIANHVRVHKQINKFNKICKYLTNNGIYPEVRHTACSAASIAYPKTQMDMVRIGMLTYGYWPSKETQIHYLHKNKSAINPLLQVITWKTQVMSLKTVYEGEFIGYGTTYMALETKQVAIVPVGYSHGFSRSLSNQGRVLIHGQRVGVLGMVNMNMAAIDVSFVDDVKIGDEVVLIGRQESGFIQVSSFSELSDQVNYELLTRLPSTINRVIKK